MINLLVKIYLAGFFTNLLYELLHSQLYKTCLEAPLKKYVYLILKASLFDGAVIVLLHVATLFVKNPYYHIILFSAVALIFAYVWEIYSLKTGKWEYAPAMPKIFGAGLTPLVQLAVTGIFSIYLVLYF